MIGDNGADKSTLIKALSGALQPDEGEISLDGERVHFRPPRDARRAGIETVYQDLAVAPRSTSLRTSSSAGSGRRGPLGSVLRMLNKGAMRREATDTSPSSRSASARWPSRSRTSRVGSARVSPSPGPRPGRKRVVIMDEPTAALGVKETRQVLDLILRVRDRAAGDPDQPRHAARLRARRPDPDHAARQARGGVTPNTHRCRRP